MNITTTKDIEAKLALINERSVQVRVSFFIIGNEMRDIKNLIAATNPQQAKAINGWLAERTGYKKSAINKLIKAADIMLTLKERCKVTELPHAESVVRPLVFNHPLYGPDDQAYIWDTVVEAAEGQPVTAKMVKEAVADWKVTMDIIKPEAPKDRTTKEARLEANVIRLQARIVDMQATIDYLNKQDNGPRLNPNSNDQMLRDIVQAGYRAMAMKNHPDKGGDVSKMQDINQWKQNHSQYFTN